MQEQEQQKKNTAEEKKILLEVEIDRENKNI